MTLTHGAPTAPNVRTVPTVPTVPSVPTGSRIDRLPPRDPARRLDFAAYLAVCVLFATIPWQDVVQVPGVGTVAKVVGLGVLVVCGLALAIFGGLRRPGESVLLLLLFTGWVVVSPIWSAFPDDSLVRVYTMLQLTVLVLLTVHVVRTPERLAGLMGAFVVGDVILGLSVLQQRAGGLTLVRYTAEGTNPNDVAFLMCLGIPMAWYLVLRLRPALLRVLLGGFVVLAVFVVVLTASRSALLLLAPALAIVPLNLRRLTPVGRSLVGATVVAGCVVAVTGAVLLPSAPLQRLGTTFSELQSGTLDNRTTLWAIGLKLFGQHPVLGVGAGVVPEYVGQSYPLQAGLHNTYLSIAVQFGVVGIVLFGLLLISVVRRALAVGAPERSVAAVLSVVFVFGLIPRHWEFTKGTWAVLAILICIAEVAGERNRTRAHGS
jgi:O-antigen ligase